jgi:hypothetical protein
MKSRLHATKYRRHAYNHCKPLTGVYGEPVVATARRIPLAFRFQTIVCCTDSQVTLRAHIRVTA